MTTPSTLQISTARSRGYDRGQTLHKHSGGGAVEIDLEATASQLYPDGGPLQSAFLEGLRAGWADANN
jgi:hypothetical protein